MAYKPLSQLIDGIDLLSRHGNADPVIKQVAYDSRKVTRGTLFVAIPGEHVDGHTFIGEAVKRGAAAVLYSDPAVDVSKAPVALQVAESRPALSHIAAAYYGNPSHRLQVVGVTGTDGKSSTVYFIHQLLEAVGAASGFVSTVAMNTSGKTGKNDLRQSTPEAPEIQAALAEMLASGKSYAVLEATSHGLSERTSRLANVRFQMGVFTNLSHEHLEFHGSMEQYRSDKGNLFRALSETPGGTAILNADDEASRYFSQISPVPCAYYSTAGAPEAELRVEKSRSDMRGSSFSLIDRKSKSTHLVRLPLVGAFNIDNALAAVLCVSRLLDMPVPELIPYLEKLEPVTGRMTSIPTDGSFHLIVDYAHTPGSFATVLPMIKQYTKGRLIVVFGSAGERDRAKRPVQGELAARYADIVILTDEDPRGEDSDVIIAEIAAGCRIARPNWKEGSEILRIVNRRAAIETAVELAEKNDTVLLLGKGHEASIIYATGPKPWNEIEIAEKLSQSRAALV
ncbi:MAG: UDP-N-acetylmuramoyl-L-alanyl-D-glutamate--2,6-diaminopimelate ligase [Spirochaetaceae bacterium]|nr:MAG: UDP-N-acetylmuramoyl-L-alanyl-D-glutamate--2,6-diaminopimelate ligase [Spirochaetaceae bacterium]